MIKGCQTKIEMIVQGVKFKLKNDIVAALVIFCMKKSFKYSHLQSLTLLNRLRWDSQSFWVIWGL